MRSDMFCSQQYLGALFSFLYSLSTPGFAQATALPASPRVHASVPSTLFWGLLPTNEVAASDTAHTQEKLVWFGRVCAVRLCMRKPRLN